MNNYVKFAITAMNVNTVWGPIKYTPSSIQCSGMYVVGHMHQITQIVYILENGR